MTIRSALFLVAALASGSAAHAQKVLNWRMLPPLPVAGEPFLLQTLVGAAPATNDGSFHATQVLVFENEIRLTTLPPPLTLPPGYPATHLVTQAITLSRFDRHLALADGDQFADFNVSPPRAAATPQFRSLSGNWFTPAENGIGLNIIQGAASGQLFSIYFTYRQGSGLLAEPQWFSIPGGKWIAPTVFQGLLYETLGSTLDVPFNTARFQARPVGTLTLTFANADRVDFDAQLTLDTSFNLIRKQVALVRQAF